MKNILVLMLIVCIFGTSGCAFGTRESRLDTTRPGIITHQGRNFSLFDQDEGAITLARAYEIKKRADLFDKLYSSGNGSNEKNAGYRIGIINNDPRKSIYFFHPEFPGQKFILKPNGGYDIIAVKNIPYELMLYSLDGKTTERIYPLDKFRRNYNGEGAGYKKYLAGIAIDVLFTVNRVN